ncbi:MAG: aspartate kinase, partial [Lutibacter sp.]|nr:aspartate kinase [Lutibacter sp.]
MKVLKFGGTSVGSIANMKMVKDIIADNEKKIVVLSAMSGTTNALVEISNFIKNDNNEEAIQNIEKLHEKYAAVINDLLQAGALKQDVEIYIESVFSFLKICTSENHATLLYNKIVAQGELLSTYIFTAYLNQEGLNAILLPALDFMRIDKTNDPDDFYIKQNLQRIIKEAAPSNIYITQGFICLDAYGNIANLQRGGSDYTATIVGAAVNAEEVQIWTDIDGMHNNDPRFVENTHA